MKPQAFRTVIAQVLRVVRRCLLLAPAHPPSRTQGALRLEPLEERDVPSGLDYFPVAVGFGAAATGGYGGPVVVADTAAEFQTFAQQSGPRTIKVQGMLNVGRVFVKSNLTIVGDGNDGLIGELRLDNVQNVIIQNLSVSNPAGAGGGDAIALTRASKVWIDHVNVYDAPDGLIDITVQSDNVTVSWSKFYYTSNEPRGHDFAMLIGASDTDTADRGKLHVTLHHNWFGTRVHERMPRARFGDIHVFNNYFNSPGNGYCIRAAIESEVLVQNNYFDSVNNPHEILVSTGINGRIESSGNVYVNTTGTRTAGSDVFNPPYAYTLDAGSSVKGVATAGAGVKTLPGTKFFVADDGSAGRMFEYSSGGQAIESYSMASASTNPRGVTSRAAGDRNWVINDTSSGADVVYVYDPAGVLLGSWTARTPTGANLSTPEGIATDGTNIWIVDAATNTVYRYNNAANLMSGLVNATSSFALVNSGTNVNTNPRGITTNGTHLWVVDDNSTDRVFKYTTAGALVGAWTIGANNSTPTDITIDPTNVNHIWIVDVGTDSVYRYNAATGRTSGSQSADNVFRLAPGNKNAQGIADPRPFDSDQLEPSTNQARLDSGRGILALPNSPDGRSIWQTPSDLRVDRKDHFAAPGRDGQARPRSAPTWTSGGGMITVGNGAQDRIATVAHLLKWRAKGWPVQTLWLLDSGMLEEFQMLSPTDSNAVRVG